MATIIFCMELAMSREWRNKDLQRSFGNFVLSEAEFEAESPGFSPQHRFKS